MSDPPADSPVARALRAVLDWRVVLALGVLALAPAPVLLFEAGGNLPVPTVAVGLGIPLALLTLAAGVVLLQIGRAHV